MEGQYLLHLPELSPKICNVPCHKLQFIYIDSYDTASMKGLVAMMQTLRRSLKSVAKKEEKTKTKKSSVEEVHLSPDDFKGYLCSQRHKDASALLNSEHPIPKSRIHILMMFVMSNPLHTGALMNMTLNEFYEAKSAIKNGSDTQ